jgi:hypothetical protein
LGYIEDAVYVLLLTTTSLKFAGAIRDAVAEIALCFFKNAWIEIEYRATQVPY